MSGPAGRPTAIVVGPIVAGHMLGVSAKTVRRMIARGQLTDVGARLGFRRTLVAVSEIRALVDAPPEDDGPECA